jgi:hypothetical protein
MTIFNRNIVNPLFLCSENEFKKIKKSLILLKLIRFIHARL